MAGVANVGRGLVHYTPPRLAPVVAPSPPLRVVPTGQETRRSGVRRRAFFTAPSVEQASPFYSVAVVTVVFAAIVSAARPHGGDATDLIAAVGLRS
jgi:hypothetical protein